MDQTTRPMFFLSIWAGFVLLVRKLLPAFFVGAVPPPFFIVPLAMRFILVLQAWTRGIYRTEILQHKLFALQFM